MVIGSLLYAENVLWWCPQGKDPFLARKEAANEALQLCRQQSDKRGEAHALLLLSTVDFANGFSLAEESLSVARTADDKVAIANALCQMASYSATLGDKGQSQSLASQAVAVARQQQDADVLARSLDIFALRDADPVRRAQTYREMACLNVTKKLGFACRLAGAVSVVVDDDPVLATALANRCLEIAQSLGDAELEGLAYRCLAQAARARGETAKAEELEVVASVLCPLPKVDVSAFEKVVAGGDRRATWDAFKAILGAT